MTTRHERPPRAARLALILTALCAAATTAASGAGRPVATYTNDDLERVRPLRGETGVTSQPAFARPTEPCRPGGARRGRSRRAVADEQCVAESETPARGAAHDETYWRREAERVRTRARAWLDQVDDLESKIAARRRLPGVPPYSDPQIVAWQRRADLLRERAGSLQNELDERAHRERALPGWLR